MTLDVFYLDEGDFRYFRLSGLSRGYFKGKKIDLKIKSQGELIDATIEMVDGVMVVSPKKDANSQEINSKQKK